jgi:hypothetical protein
MLCESDRLCLIWEANYLDEPAKFVRFCLVPLFVLYGHIVLNTKHPTADAIVASDRAAGEAPAGTEIAGDRLPGVPSRFGGVIAGAPRSAAFEANITA